MCSRTEFAYSRNAVGHPDAKVSGIKKNAPMMRDAPLSEEPASPHETRVRTVHVGYARVLLDHLREQGVNVLKLYSQDELARLQGHDELSRCSLEDWHQAVATAQTHLAGKHPLGADDLALTLAESIKPWHTGIVGYDDDGLVGAARRRQHPGALSASAQ